MESTINRSVFRDNNDDMEWGQVTSAYEIIKEPIFILSSKLELIYWNEAVEKIYGFKTEDLLYQNLYSVANRTWINEKDIQKLQLGLQKRGWWKGPITSYSLSGEKLPMQISANAHRDIKGNIDYYVCLLHDATQLSSSVREMEQALRETQEHFFKIFNLSPSMMSIYCLEKGNGGFQHVNPKFCQLTGYTEEEIINKSICDLKILPDNSILNWFFPQIKREGKINPVEIKFSDRDGKEHTGILSAEVMEIDKKDYCLCVIKDITELKHMEHEIARLDRLSIVAELAASIGHEVRNPMTAINGFLQMFSKREEYKEDKDIIELMIEELNRANMIITDFLSLAKEKESFLEPNNLNKVIEKLSPLIVSKAMSEDKVVDFNYGEIPEIKLDEKEIRQMVFNLVQNGLDVIESGKKITVTTFCKGKEVILAIRDQGPGISPEIIDKMGTPFFTTKEKGTGLGLCVCYSIAARHNAEIKIDTDESGTCFYIKFKIG